MDRLIELFLYIVDSVPILYHEEVTEQFFKAIRNNNEA